MAGSDTEQAVTIRGSSRLEHPDQNVGAAAIRLSAEDPDRLGRS